jgi:hypothetical protein
VVPNSIPQTGTPDTPVGWVEDVQGIEGAGDTSYSLWTADRVIP